MTSESKTKTTSYVKFRSYADKNNSTNLNKSYAGTFIEASCKENQECSVTYDYQSYKNKQIRSRIKKILGA